MALISPRHIPRWQACAVVGEIAGGKHGTGRYPRLSENSATVSADSYLPALPSGMLGP
jgi:hypothetical protein